MPPASETPKQRYKLGNFKHITQGNRTKFTTLKIMVICCKKSKKAKFRDEETMRQGGLLPKKKLEFISDFFK